MGEYGKCDMCERWMRIVLSVVGIDLGVKRMKFVVALIALYEYIYLRSGTKSVRSVYNMWRISGRSSSWKRSFNCIFNCIEFDKCNLTQLRHICSGSAKCASSAKCWKYVWNKALGNKSLVSLFHCWVHV